VEGTGRDLWIKGMFWLFPIIFTAGGLLWQINTTTTQVADLAEKMDTHERRESHPVTAAILEGHEKILAVLVDEQQIMRQEVQAQAVDIAAICQATGANCR